MYTIGYPAGAYRAVEKTNHSLEPDIRETMCSKVPGRYDFEFQGEAVGGASGSPIFNKHGELVGVLWGGWKMGSTLGLACQARYLKEMYEEEGGPMNKVMVYACRLLMIWAFIPFGMNAQTAKWAIAPQYSSITPYGEDMYKVKIGKQVGVVDKDGKIIVGVYADSITNMVEDCSLVLRFVDGKNKLVSILHKDKTTSQISEDWYVGNYTFFSEGKLPVCNKKGRFGYIGPNGRVILDFAYSVAHPFSEGWASVCKGKNLFSVGLNAVSRVTECKKQG